MFPKETRDRQERLSAYIYELATKVLDKEKNEHLKIIQKMQVLYQDGFKHSYSDFFPIISQILESDTEYSRDYLTNNLEIIRETLELDYSNGENQFKDIYSQFTKLCDHLNLQISEMTYFSKTESKVNDASIQMQKTKEDLEKAASALEESNAHAKSLQTELIAVLSIFAAIVTTFSGGFTFLGSVMTSIGSAKQYEMVVLTAVICGMVIFNTIFLMMFFVAKITERNIYANCKKRDCANCTSKCNGIKKIKKRLPYVFYFNVLGVIGIICDMVIWLLDIKGFLG